MDDKKRTLDLTMFDRRNFAGKFRLRYLFDWAKDYWEQGLELTKVKLCREEYEDLIRDFEINNTFVRKHKITELLTINLGFGEVEVENADKKGANSSQG